MRIWILILLPIVALAQSRSRSLTMDDVSPLRETQPRLASEPAPSSEAEKLWQDRLLDARMGMLDLKLRIAKDETNADLKVEMKKQQLLVDELQREGSVKGYRERRPYDLEYRERYVDLRLQMIEEEKKNVTTRRSNSSSIYIEADQTRRRNRRQLRTTAPVIDARKLEAKLTRLEQLEEQLELLQEEGRRLGVSPGIFRD
ncbi:MAG: hypothetical protein RMM17_10250 [Acidobacteriota bacterium]|nr:hypothetical protein [Blastocatellia bacterium]MDW8413050.1 hypothetical protein [Acidobacteriota bacterium]